MLADQHPYTYPRHVESVQERLDRVVDLHSLSFPLVFEDALRYSGHNTVMPPLDLLQCGLKLCVVVVELRRPVSIAVVCRAVISSRLRRGRFLVVDLVVSTRLVFALRYTGIRCGLRYSAISPSVLPRRFEKPFFYFRGQSGFW